MQKSIKMFKENLEIDLKKLIATRMLVCANSGGGKSWAVRKLLEETYGTQAIILDMEGEFHTLREKFDFLLIGGIQGDLVLNPKATKLYPKIILEQNVSTILDMSELKHQERILFVRDFLNALMELPRNLWRPLLVVIDEVHKLAGQQEKQESTFAVIDLMAQGRKRGFCGILCTQRISKLHKDAAAEANNYMIGRTSLDIDMQRASDILGFKSKEQMLSLRNLTPGNFFVYGPAISNEITEVTVDKVKTTHPEPGALLDINITPPNAKIKSMLTKLNELPQEAAKQIKDLREAQARIRQLEIMLKQKPKSNEPDISALKALKTTELQLKNDLKIEQNETVRLHSQMTKIRKVVEHLQDLLPTENKVVFVKESQNPISPILKKPEAMPKPEKQIPIKNVANLESDLSLGKGEKSILSFLIVRPDTNFSTQQIGAMTGYAPTSGTFNTYLSKLSSLGLIERNQGSIKLVDELKAREAIGDFTHDFSLESWLNKLGAGPKKIYQILLENPMQEFTKEEIGEQTGYVASSGTFNTYLSELSTLGLITRSGGKIKLNEAIQGI